MAEFEINPKTISWRELVRQMRSFLESKPDYLAWKDFYDAGAGTTLIEIIGAYGTFSKRDLLAQTRENYLLTAKNIENVVSIGNNKNYPSFRGKNAHFRLKILPNQTIGISKFQIVGSIKNVDLIALESTNLIQDTFTYIDVVLGEKFTSTLTANDDSLQIFRFIEQNVSEDFRLIINNVEVPVSYELLDLLNDKWYALTNGFGGLDFYYLNEGDYTYTSLTDLVLEYVKTNDLDYDFPNDITFDYGLVQGLVGSPTEEDTQILSFFIPFESIDSIKIKAPLRYETQKAVRGREDFKKILYQLNSEFIDTNGYDISPAFIGLTYLKEDETFLTELQKLEYIEKLNSYCLYGVWLPDGNIFDPEKVEYSLNIELKAQPSIDLSNVNNGIQEIFNYTHERNALVTEDTRIERRQKKLQATLDLQLVEHELNYLPEIKISRVSFNTSVYAINTIYKRGNFVTAIVDNGKMFECVKEGTSFSTEPTWNTTDNYFTIENPDLWVADTTFSDNDVILPTDYNGKAYIALTGGLTGSSEPNWTTTKGELNYDGAVTWQCIDIIDIPNKVIWKTRSKDITEISINWNEYIKLNYGESVTWL